MAHFLVSHPSDCAGRHSKSSFDGFAILGDDLCKPKWAAGTIATTSDKTREKSVRRKKERMACLQNHTLFGGCLIYVSPVDLSLPLAPQQVKLIHSRFYFPTGLDLTGCSVVFVLKIQNMLSWEISWPSAYRVFWNPTIRSEIFHTNEKLLTTSLSPVIS